MKGFFRSKLVLSLVALLLLAGAIALPLAISSHHVAQTHAAGSTGNAQSLEGGWRTTITLQGNSPFLGLITFAAGGGLVDTQQIDFNQKATPGIGSWSATGENTFVLKFYKIASDAKGNLNFTVRFNITVQLTADQNAFHGTGTFTVFDSHDKKLFTHTLKFDGTRIQVDGN